MKQNLRFLLNEPFGGLKKDTLDELENVVKNFSVSFSLFCAENYIHLHSDRWIKYLGDDKEFETEELYNKFIESYDKKSN
jgi:hypothetical protein